MRANGISPPTSPGGKAAVIQVTAGPPRELVRLRPETWQLLAALRRPLLDSEGNLVGFESFDRLVRRILDERRNPNGAGTRPQGRRP